MAKVDILSAYDACKIAYLIYNGWTFEEDYHDDVYWKKDGMTRQVHDALICTKHGGDYRLCSRESYQECYSDKYSLDEAYDCQKYGE